MVGDGRTGVTLSTHVRVPVCLLPHDPNQIQFGNSQARASLDGLAAKMLTAFGEPPCRGLMRPPRVRPARVSPRPLASHGVPGMERTR
jgi:hypothetical protein